MALCCVVTWGLSRAGLGASAASITLAALNDTGSATLIGERLGGDRSVAELTATIRARAAGNPLLAEELVRDLAERGVLSGDPGAYTCHADVGDVTVAATLQTTIAARIDRLGPQAKRVLCVAAVIGSRFGGDLLALLCVDVVPRGLLDTELIDRVTFGAREEYAFRHPLIRMVATSHSSSPTALGYTGGWLPPSRSASRDRSVRMRR